MGSGSAGSGAEPLVTGAMPGRGVRELSGLRSTAPPHPYRIYVVHTKVKTAVVVCALLVAGAR